MKPLHVLILALIVVGAGSAIWYTSQSGSSTASAVEQKLFPGMGQQLDAVSRLTVKDAGGGQVVIEKKDGSWVMGSKPGYYADTAKVGNLLVAAAEAVQVETKTANPELYSRLGLGDISDAESEALQLTVEAAGQTYEVLLGNRSDRFGGATFVRKPAESTSFLVSPALVANTDVDSWLDKRVFDIQSDEVQSVTVTDADGNTTEIRKEAMFGSEFDVVGREEGQIINDAAVRDLARGLTGLRFDGVSLGVAFPVNAYKRRTVTYTLFSGVQIDVTLFYREQEEDDADEESGPSPEPKYWMNAGARFDEAIAQQFVPQPGSATESDGEPQRLTLTPADLADRRAEVEAINSTRQRWIYRIPSARFERMTPKFDSLVAPPE